MLLNEPLQIIISIEKLHNSTNLVEPNLVPVLRKRRVKFSSVELFIMRFNGETPKVQSIAIQSQSYKCETQTSQNVLKIFFFTLKAWLRNDNENICNYYKLARHFKHRIGFLGQSCQTFLLQLQKYPVCQRSCLHSQIYQYHIFLHFLTIGSIFHL